MSLTHISIKARREALGLGQESLARVLGTTQATLNRWERGQRSPENPDQVGQIITRLEDAMLNLEDKIYQDGKAQGDPALIMVFRTDEQFHAVDPSAAEAGLPASFYRIAAARAATQLRDELDINARIDTV